MHPLDGVYEKIARARVHEADLARRLAAVLGPDKQRFVLDHEPDSETGSYHVRVFGVPAIAPEWLTIIGDCLHNLRSALDHLAWQLVVLDGKSPSDEDMTTFPIRDSPFNRKGNLRPPIQLKPAVTCPKIIRAVEAVQPYSDSGNPPDPAVLNPLWALHRLNIIDKHRLLVVAVYTLNLGETWWGTSGDEPSPTFHFHPVAVRQEGTSVGSFDLHGRQPPQTFNGGLHLVINEAELSNLTLNGVENTLENLIFHVEHMLIRQFVPLFPVGVARSMGTIRPVSPISGMSRPLHRSPSADV
jgi:hypothetical protein